jgi:biotin carboxylase
MMRVLLLSHTTGYQLRAFNDAAAELGIQLLFATDRCHMLDDPWQDHAVAVRFHDLERSVEAIRRTAEDAPVAGVIAVGDRPVVLAAHAAAALGLPWHSIDGAVASADKRRSRAALAMAGLPSPNHVVVRVGSAHADLPRDGGVEYPCVLKPIGLSGSRGVIRADSPAEFAAAFGRIRALLARPQVRSARAGLEDEILVESFIPGREYAIEAVATHGRLTVFAIFDKPDPLDGPFFEETIYVTPSRASRAVQRAIVSTVERAVDALGLQHGPVHAECRVGDDGRVFVLEVAARPIGGLCSRVLRFGGPERTAPRDRGWSLEHVLLEHALQRPIDGYERERDAAAVMMIPIPARGLLKGIAGEEDARAVPGVDEVRITAKRDQLLEPLPEAGSYLGFIFARGTTPRDAEHAVRAAHACLRFDIASPIPITAR